MTGLQFLYLALIFLAVAGGVVGIGLVVSRRAEMVERLRGVEPGSGEAAAAGMWKAAFVKAAEPVARLAQPTDAAELTKFRQRFYHAGLRRPSAPVLFFAAKVVLAIGLPVAFFFAARIFLWKVPGNMPYVALVLLAAIGYYLPNGVLENLVRRRQREIFEAFPDAIDLIIVCVEAGLSLDMAINRASEEMQLRSRALADELKLVGLELRVGASRERALRNLAARTGVEEVSMFVAMLLQADRFGTSIAESLRIHAEELRFRRRIRAEEAAAKIPVKLLFPLIFCIFPSMFAVMLGPSMIKIYRIMLPALSGG